MKRSGKIPGYSGNFYKYEIESGDTEQIEQDCLGFIHGGKMMYLPKILDGLQGGLKSSNLLRDGGETFRSRDVSREAPNGAGIYFRFIPKDRGGIERLLATVTGPGASGGFFFCMRTKDTVGLKFYTMNSNDVKYSIMNSARARQSNSDESGELVEKMRQIAREVKRQAGRRQGINNSEIAFYQSVPLNKIGEILLLKSSTDSSKMWMVDSKVYQDTYCRVFPDHEEGRQPISRPPRPEAMLDLLARLLAEKGFSRDGEVRVSAQGRTDIYIRYVRPSQRVFALRASASGVSASSAPSASPAGAAVPSAPSVPSVGVGGN